jgi:hypothetical protein
MLESDEFLESVGYKPWLPWNILQR